MGNVTSEVRQLNRQRTDAFKKAYDELPRGIYLKVNKELRAELGWSQSLLYMRLSGTRAVQEYEEPVIKNIFAKHGINVFT